MTTVARQSTLKSLKYPVFSRLDLDQGYNFEPNALKKELMRYSVGYEQSTESGLERSTNETGWAHEQRTRKLYEESLSQQVNQVIAELQLQRPNLPAKLSVTNQPLLKLANNMPKLHGIILGWSQNRAFLHYIDKLTQMMTRFYALPTAWDLYSGLHSPLSKSHTPFTLPTLHDLVTTADVPPSTRAPSSQPPSPVPRSSKGRTQTRTLNTLLTQLKACAQGDLERLYLENLEDSINAFATIQPLPDTQKKVPSFEALKVQQNFAREASSRGLYTLREYLIPRTYTSTLIAEAGLQPLITPIILLRQLSFSNRHLLPQKWLNCILQYAVQVQDARRADRMVQLLLSGRKSYLSAEIEHRREWEPLDNPDWLLIEIDADFSIRPDQANMAAEMIKPHGNRNSVMQLNMGEGKSSVIVPVVSVSAVNGPKSLSRVIVLRSQMRQQFHILRRTVTNLCNRRVLYLPFTRDLEIEKGSAQLILQVLKASAKGGWIWLCEPEQLLSLKLLGLDWSLSSDSSAGKHLLDLQSWIHRETRDTIDESDEVFQTRQQVIYTVGSAKSLEGAPWRWELVQRLLGLLATYIRRMKDQSKYNDSFIIEESERAGAFPTIRFKNEEAIPLVHDFIQYSILENDWLIKPDLIQIVCEFVTSDSFPNDTYHILEKHFPKTQSQALSTALILRGLLQKKVIYHVLKDKRYRVNYGLDLTRSLLAVPYRAKDLPSPRSEFGHPDVTILLTCLSYYFKGLDSGMIKQTLKQLQKTGTPELTYSEWIHSCQIQVPEDLKTLRGVNMQDEGALRQQLFPLLEYNKLFIDSYLNWVVFPKSAKEFPSKLSSSGWDLAMEKVHLTTGFSGTNDGRFLLPATMTQLDRPPQLHTNAKVLSCLLQKENSSVHSYKDSGHSSDLIVEMRKLSPRPMVMLDVGAQVLDKSNKQFAYSWISYYKDDPEIKAVVFFEEEDLMVMTPDGLAQPLIDSPYSERLDQCLVYLDDAHTRGTDLRLGNVLAVVTLGPRLTKDKLVQGCMRMRKLGHGQSVIFLASDEVISLIKASNSTVSKTRSKAEPKIGSKEVLIWTIRETWRQLQADLPAYVVQGHSFVRRAASWKDREEGKLSHKQLAEHLCERESRTLEELYGPSAGNELSWIWDYHSPKAQSKISRSIYDRCKDFRSFSIADATLNEEKEIELEQEKEVEIVMERARPANKAEHHLHQDINNFISTGSIPRHSTSFFQVDRALLHTSVPLPDGLLKVLGGIVVTKDFYHTVQLPTSPSIGCMDDFIRPVEWLMIPKAQRPHIAVALSPFEVNELLPTIKASTAVRLYMFAPRNSLSTRSFETFDTFYLPSKSSFPAVPPLLVRQINLFSGSVFLQDYKTYRDVCKMLGLHFGMLDRRPSSSASSADHDLVDSTYFVVDQATRRQLGLKADGFQESPVPFLRKLLAIRRYGQPLGPSHMGKLLQGQKLSKDDF